MIQVLNRAFNILEYISEEPDKPRLLSEIATYVDLNQATCAHIVKTMTNRGYLDKLDSRKGYILGPMPFHITGKESVRKDLLVAAEPLVYELSQRIRENVVLSTFRNNKKYIVCQAEGDQDIQVNKTFRLLDDLYQTATGRVLLANLSDDKLDLFLTEYGLPEKKWKECSSERKLREVLADIKKKKLAVDTDLPNVVYVASPVFDGKNMVASLGISLPRMRFKNKHKKTVIESVTKYSKVIGAKLQEGVSL